MKNKRTRRRARRPHQDRDHGDFREFVFTVTGVDTKLNPFSMLDLQDNLDAEIGRLDAIAELLSFVQDELQPSTLEAVGTLMKDSLRRIRRIMVAAFPPNS